MEYKDENSHVPAHYVQVDMRQELIPKDRKEHDDITVNAMTVPVAYDKCHLGWSILSASMCGLLGLVAVVMSILGYTDHRTGNYTSYARRRRCAIGFMVAAFILGAFFVVTYAFYIHNVITDANQHTANMEHQKENYRSPYDVVMHRTFD